MAVKGLLSEEAGPIEGIVDTGVIVIGHFENPARAGAFEFLQNVLVWKKRCLIPVSTIIGAYHIMTEYLGVDRLPACKALSKTLETRSPAFYRDVDVDSAREALTYALAYEIESWDGYLIHLAKTNRAPIIYSVDQELTRRAREVMIVNPLPHRLFVKYNNWLKEKLGSQRASAET